MRGDSLSSEGPRMEQNGPQMSQGGERGDRKPLEVYQRKVERGKEKSAGHKSPGRPKIPSSQRRVYPLSLSPSSRASIIAEETMLSEKLGIARMATSSSTSTEDLEILSVPPSADGSLLELRDDDEGSSKHEFPWPFKSFDRTEDAGVDPKKIPISQEVEKKIEAKEKVE